MTVDPSVVEADLAAGRLGCPGCAGRLAAWGHARERAVRMLDGVWSLRPRRAYCRACETTHVLLPAWSGAAPARWRAGDRLSAAGQGWGCWAPHERGDARSPAGDRARLAAYVRSPRRGD